MPLVNLSFVKLTSSCLNKIRPQLIKQLPHSIQILNLVDLQLRGKILRKTFQTEIYGIADTEIISFVWTPTPFYDIWYRQMNFIYLPPVKTSSFDYFEKNTEDVIYSYVKLLDWTKTIDFESVPLRMAPHLVKIMGRRGGKVESKEQILILKYPGDTKELDIKKYEERAGDRFELKMISTDQMDVLRKINDQWQYSYENGEAYLEEILNLYDCFVGIFRRGEINAEGLVSWGTLLPLGTLGCLHTLKEVRGNGLAQWTFEKCLKLAVEKENLLPVCEVLRSNKSSKALMKKIGMKVVKETFWIRYEPPPMDKTGRLREKLTALKTLKLF